jgi:hypothetical protein
MFTNFRYLKAHLEKAHSHLIDGTFAASNVKLDTDNTNNCVQSCEEQTRSVGEYSMDVDHNDSFSESINLTSSFMTFIGQLQSKANLSLANIQVITENMQVFLNDFAEFSCSKVRELSSNVSSMPLDQCINNCITDISNLTTCILPVDSDHKRWGYMKTSGFLLEPVQIKLGTRNEKKYVAALGRRDEVIVDDTMQYVPLEQLLGMIMLDNKSSKLISDFRKQCCEHDDEIIKHFFHTQTFKQHPFFSRYTDAFALHLYTDGFEVTNPLGSHTSVHKMEALYLIVQNFPSECQSKLSNIFLVAMWYAMDVKKYGYDQILAPVINSLKQLESEQGVLVTMRGTQLLVRASLVMVSADNLGFNSLFGFSESFNALKFCRFCETTRMQAERCFTEDQFVMRTRVSYDTAVSQLNLPGHIWSETGIKRGCILNQLNHFHVTTNMCVDSMHDLLEGVAPYELSLILEQLRIAGFITLDQLNTAVIGFDYGLADVGSRPPEINSLTSLRMSASEMWCFVRNLPLFIGHFIPRDEPHWKLLLIFLDICDIVFSPATSKNLCSYLSHLIAEHHSLFKEIFPNNALIPKHHFMIHYPQCLLKSGPSVRYWAMRFEARHNFFKELGRISRCYKNICKTLAKRFQFSLAFNLMTEQLHPPLERVGTSTEVTVFSLSADIVQLITDTLRLSNQDTIFTLKSVDVGHYTYREGCVVILSVNNATPEFGSVIKIFNVDRKNYLVIKKFQTCHYDDHFHAYVITQSNQLQIVLLNCLKDFVPLQFQNIVYEGSDQSFITLRHILF